MRAFRAPRLDVSICFGLVARSLFVSMFDSTFRLLWLSKEGFRIEGIATNMFHSCLEAFGSRFPDFCVCLENKFERRKIFVMKLDPSKWIWWARSWGYLGPLKT